MRRVAFHTLGCKVNQYDTQAMLELFESAGYEQVPFEEKADVYVINTCTVTGTGDKKSLQLIRRIARKNPEAVIVVAGCLAQRDSELVKLPGVRTIIGTQRRGEVVSLLEQALESGSVVVAVETLKEASFEHLSVSAHEGKTRATMKIQEGCDRYCSYCIIPSVRGPVRSMPLSDIEREAVRLAQAGYCELVLTGIHLASYGRDSSAKLIDAIKVVHSIPEVARIRLGSLEPVVITEEFVDELVKLPKVCRQFHLSLQSGSDTVLKRMNRRYTSDEYFEAVLRLRSKLNDCAITTDIIAGFPGETEDEADETLEFVKNVNFARIHVFPYSIREGTLAARMPNQVPPHIKQERVARLIELGEKMEHSYLNMMIGVVCQVLFEEEMDDRLASGYTGEYIRVIAPARAGQIANVLLKSVDGDSVQADIL